MALFWSVERDGDTIVATCPSALGDPGTPRPGWMVQCSSAIRDELRELGIEDATVLEATLTGREPLAEALLANVGMPQAQVHAGVRLRQGPPGDGGAVLGYRRVALGAAADDEDAPVAAVRVAITDGHEIESADEVARAVRAVAGTPPPGSAAAVDIRVRFVTGLARTHGSTELIRRLLDGICEAYGIDQGTLQVVDVTVEQGPAPLLEIELRAAPAPAPGA